MDKEPIAGADDTVLRLRARIAALEERFSTAREDHAGGEGLTASLAAAEKLAHVGGWEWNVTDGAFRMTPEFRRILGLAGKRDESLTLRRIVEERVHREDRGKVLDAAGKASSGKPGGRFAFRVVRPDGEIRWVEATPPSVWKAADDGTPRILIGAVLDVTDRVRSKEELRRSEEKFSKAFAVTPDGALISRLSDGRIIDCSPSLCATFGWEPGKAIGKTTLELNVWPDAEDRRKVVQKLRDEGSFTNLRVRVCHDDGHIFNTLASARRIDIDGEPCMLTIIRDMTELDETMATLRQLRRALDETFDGFATIDLDGTVTSVNRAWAAMHGWTKEELIGKNFSIFHTPEQMKNDVLPVFRQLREGKFAVNDVGHVRKGGETFPTRMSSSYLRDESGKPVGVLGIARDMTEQCELEKRLRHSQKMEAVGTLAGGIAHDFNNLLYVILGYTDLAMGDLGEESPPFHSLSEARKAILRASDLVARIVRFSRGTERLRGACEPAPVLEEVLGLIEGSVPATVELRTRIAAGDHRLALDATQLHQVVMNLCTNALHAMREKGGVLTVAFRVEEDTGETARAPGEAAGMIGVLTIGDTGEGMTPSVLERIFEPYYSKREGGTGSGLGLPTVHGIMRECGGSISVKSEPGAGSEFTVRIPLTDEEPTGLDDGRTLPVVGKGSGRVLFLDDMEQITKWAKTILEGRGYVVEPFTSAKKAIERFRSDPEAFDIVITDQTMPGMSGVDVANEVRKIRPELPVVLCTGYSDSVDRTEAERLGIGAFLIKPITSETLAAVMNDLLKGKGKADRAR